ncbi:hypothetical protein [Herbidospora daliensis]|uniref:hypothetical protein n=1 Tax=Herbidospora daliensis TaxID=295585 RepID=UPI000A409B84|nr:hypothetical protein [Herbidospora daliensis]
MSSRSRVLSAASLCAAALAALAFTDALDLVLWREHLDRPFAFSALAFFLATLAAAGLRPAWARDLLMAFAGLATAATLLVAVLALAFSSIGEDGFVDGPDPYRIRVQQTMAGLGPDAVMWLSLRRDDGLLSREWELGCFNDDVPGDGFDSVRWTGPDTLEIRVGDGRAFPVALHPGSGRPQTTASLNC